MSNIKKNKQVCKSTKATNCLYTFERNKPYNYVKKTIVKVEIINL